MNELPKNPNIRQPYADVSLDLQRIVGDVCEFLGFSKAELDVDDQWDELQRKLRMLDQCILRASAVLDPTSLTDEQWKQALIQPGDIK